MKLAEVVTISKRKESRKDRVVPWTDFEPLLNQLRVATDRNQDDAMRLCGYGTGTMIATWRNEGVPVLAMNAIRYILHDLGVKQERKIEKQFSFNELTLIFAVLQGWPAPADAGKELTKKIARELQNAV